MKDSSSYHRWAVHPVFLWVKNFIFHHLKCSCHGLRWEALVDIFIIFVFSASVKSSWVSWVHYIYCIQCFQLLYGGFYIILIVFFFFFGTVKYTIFSCVNWYYMHILISTFSSSVQIPGNDFCLCQEETQWGRRNELSQVVLWPPHICGGTCVPTCTYTHI